MTKLPNLQPRLGGLSTRLNTPAPRDEQARSKYRAKTEPSFKWLNSARWKRLRMSILVRDQFRCRRCGRFEPDSRKLVADHVVPHRNDPDQFWNGALQCLCRNCHSSAKQAEEAKLPKGIWY